MIAVFMLYTFVSSYLNAKELRRITNVKIRDGYQFDPSDIRFENDKAIIKMMAYTFVAGLLGGIVGIGGGIILSPLFLQLGMLPIIVANTN
jgi:uncharacterized membrane protein YfcA